VFSCKGADMGCAVPRWGNPRWGEPDGKLEIDSGRRGDRRAVAGTGFQLNFIADPNATYRVWASSNLVTGPHLGAATSTSNGWFQRCGKFGRSWRSFSANEKKLLLGLGCTQAAAGAGELVLGPPLLI